MEVIGDHRLGRRLRRDDGFERELVRFGQIVFGDAEQTKLLLADCTLRDTGLNDDDLQGDPRRVAHLSKRLEQRAISALDSSGRATILSLRLTA